MKNRTLLILLCLSTFGILASEAYADVIDHSGGSLSPPDDDPAGSSSTITIATNETITNLELRLFNSFHTWVGDLHVTLTGPGGTTTIFSRTGSFSGSGVGDSSNLVGDYFFRDGGDDWWFEADERGNNEALVTGTYQATENMGGVISLTDVFAGTSTAGDWTLFVSDNSLGDIGNIAGWGLFFESTAVPEPGTTGLLALAHVICAFYRRRRFR